LLKLFMIEVQQTPNLDIRLFLARDVLTRLEFRSFCTFFVDQFRTLNFRRVAERTLVKCR
jgi:hypothetical protein